MGSRGTVATETDAAETFKMHAPLIGNRADCVREKGNERSSSLCLWGMECPATKGSGPSREAWEDGTGVGLPDKIAIEKHTIKEVWPTAANRGGRQKSPDTTAKGDRSQATRELSVGGGTVRCRVAWRGRIGAPLPCQLPINMYIFYLRGNH